MAANRLDVRTGYSCNPDEVGAVRELREALGSGPDLAAVLFFCSSRFDLDVLGRELGRAFPSKLVGCTTAGEVSPAGYVEHSLTGVAIHSPDLVQHTFLLRDLKGVADEARRVHTEIARIRARDPRPGFALLLVDGLSGMEELVTAHLSSALGTLPLVGGSAGDDMAFRQTHVFAEGRFHTGAAVLSLFLTDLPFREFRTQHFVATEEKLVITSADTEHRIVREINGGPAAWEYARAVGLEVAQLEPMIFAKYPVMLQVGDEYYIRSIQRVNADGSLTFFCAIDEGLVLTIARGEDLVQNLEDSLQRLERELPDPKLILGCDCILRRLEMKETGVLERVSEIARRHRFIGFSTYGEQVGAVHVNQTFTGVALGG